jgi:vacuolar-type H+-ATPase catalytic subunit A/Vma1
MGTTRRSTQTFPCCVIKSSSCSYPSILLPYARANPNSLSDSEELDQVVQLVGKSALSDPDKITLDVSSLIKEDFLQQNGYSKHDQYCPVWKTLWMMKAMMGFYDESQKAVQNGVSWAKIREATSDIQHQLRSMKFEVSFDLAFIWEKTRV